MKQASALLILMALMLVSCLRQEKYPLEPLIEFHSFTKLINPPDTSLVLKLSFTDGDGDIGLYSKDTVPPYDYNLFVDIYKRSKGQLVKVVFPNPDYNFNGRIPIITPDIRNKSIKGMIEYKFDYVLLRNFLRRDTIAFEVFIKDRALNQSNTVRSSEIIIL